MKRLVLGFVLLITVQVSSAAWATSGPSQRVEIRGRQHFAVRGQPVRNWARWWFGSVPVPPKPVQQ